MCRQEADLDENLSNTQMQEGDETLKGIRKMKKKRQRKKSPISDFVENMEGIKSNLQSVQEKAVPLASSVDHPLPITEVVATVEECGTVLNNSSFRTQAAEADFQSEFLIAETDRSIRKKKKVNRNPRKGSVDDDASMSMKHCSRENPVSISLQCSDTKTPMGLTKDQTKKPPEESLENKILVEKKAPSASGVPLAKKRRHKRKKKLDNGSLPVYSTTAELIDKTSQSTTTEGEMDCASGKCLKSLLPNDADVCSKMKRTFLSDNNCRKSTNDKTNLSSLPAVSADLVIKGNIDGNNQANIIPCALEAEQRNHKKKKNKKKGQISSVDKNLVSSENCPSTTPLHSSESTMNGVLKQDEICKSKMMHDVSNGENLEGHGKRDTYLSLVNDGCYLENTSSTYKENNMLEKLADLHVLRPLSSLPRRKLLILDLNGLLVEPVVEFLLGDMRSKLLFCWDGSFCTKTGLYTIENRKKPLVLKELNKIWEKEWEKVRYTPSCTLLVDDSPYKALFNPAYTGIFPRSFNLNKKADNALGRRGNIRAYLEGLLKADDVREYVKNKPFGQRAITTDHPDWDFYKQVLVTRVEDDSEK